jgi:glycine/D-amino acid oxidase-like deaminating enzyme
VRVTTANDTFEAEKLIVTAGAWSGQLLNELGIALEILRKPVLWFEVDPAHKALALPDRMPVFISDDEHGEFYGVPQYDVPGVKVGMHSGGDVVDPNSVDRTVTEPDIRADIWPFVQRSFRGFTGDVVDSSVCMYTMTPDRDFVIDRHPEHDRVTYATGFSGHGFKFAPVVGQYLASLVSDDSTQVLDDFAIARFATVS